MFIHVHEHVVKRRGSKVGFSCHYRALAANWYEACKVLARYWYDTGTILAQYWHDTGTILVEYLLMSQYMPGVQGKHSVSFFRSVTLLNVPLGHGNSVA